MKGLLWAVQTCGKSLKHWGTGCSSLRSYNFHHRWASFFLWFSSFLFLLSFFVLSSFMLPVWFVRSFILSFMLSFSSFHLFTFLFFNLFLLFTFIVIFSHFLFTRFLLILFYTFLNPFQDPIHSFCSFSFVNCYLHWFLLFNELSFI